MKKINAFQTSDNKVFTDKKEAELNEATLNVSATIRKLFEKQDVYLGRDGSHEERVKDICEAIIKDPVRLHKALSDYIKLKGL